MYPPERLARAVALHVQRVRARGERIDYLTFVPDGEPTLDANLGREIELLRPLGIPIAVITNGSLAWRPQVRAALRGADWLSVKVDATDEPTWRRVNRPLPSSTRSPSSRASDRSPPAFPASSCRRRCSSRA
jgi:wyosine [tRNA(Phe)-imidazoG37] synthetase (radical SAM superfamily)